MDPSYAVSYRQLYQHHWWWRARESMVLGLLRRMAPAEGFGKILDIGCGDGLFFSKLRTLGDPEGLEPDASIVSGQGRAQGTIHIRPFDETFEPANRFGLILMLDVLEHLEDPVGALVHAKTLLEPDGRLVLTVPAFSILWTAHDDYNNHLRRYRLLSLELEARQADLEIELLRYYFHWMFPVKWMVSLTERMQSNEPPPAQVPRPFVNKLLYFISRLEQLVTAKLRLPFGSSIVAVLR